MKYLCVFLLACGSQAPDVVIQDVTTTQHEDTPEARKQLALEIERQIKPMGKLPECTPKDLAACAARARQVVELAPR